MSNPILRELGAITRAPIPTSTSHVLGIRQRSRQSLTRTFRKGFLSATTAQTTSVWEALSTLSKPRGARSTFVWVVALGMGRTKRSAKSPQLIINLGFYRGAHWQCRKKRWRMDVTFLALLQPLRMPPQVRLGLDPPNQRVQRVLELRQHSTLLQVGIWTISHETTWP